MARRISLLLPVAALVLGLLPGCHGQVSRQSSDLAQAPTPAPAAAPANYDWTALTAKLQSYVPQTVSGLGFMVARDGQVIYAQAFGNQQVDTVLPIASSSKMPSAAVIMSLVDGGLLDLDKPVGTYLAGTIDWPQDKAAITLRM